MNDLLANTIVGGDAVDPGPFYQQPGFWALIVFGLFFVIAICCAVYFDQQQKWKRQEKRNEKQRSLARWRAVSDVVRRIDPETNIVGEPGIYELKIVLETPKGRALKAVELWRYDMADPDFVNQRGVKLGEARAMAADLNSELEKPITSERRQW